MVLAACNSTEAGPANALSQAITHLKAGEFEKFRMHLTDDENPEFFFEDDGRDELDFLLATVHHFDYEVLEQEVTGDEANLRIRATNAAGDLIMSELFSFGSTLMSELTIEAGPDALVQLMVASLRANDAPTRTEIVHVALRKVDGKWLLVIPATDASITRFWNALFAFLPEG